MMPRLKQVRRRIVEYVRGDHELTVWFADAVFHLFGKVIGAFFADEPVQRDLAAVGGAELDRDGVTRTPSLGHGRLQSGTQPCSLRAPVASGPSYPDAPSQTGGAVR